MVERRRVGFALIAVCLITRLLREAVFAHRGTSARQTSAATDQPTAKQQQSSPFDDNKFKRSTNSANAQNTIHTTKPCFLLRWICIKELYVLYKVAQFRCSLSLFVYRLYGSCVYNRNRLNFYGLWVWVYWVPTLKKKYTRKGVHALVSYFSSTLRKFSVEANSILCYVIVKFTWKHAWLDAVSGFSKHTFQMLH